MKNLSKPLWLIMDHSKNENLIKNQTQFYFCSILFFVINKWNILMLLQPYGIIILKLCARADEKQWI